MECLVRESKTKPNRMYSRKLFAYENQSAIVFFGRKLNILEIDLSLLEKKLFLIIFIIQQLIPFPLTAYARDPTQTLQGASTAQPVISVTAYSDAEVDSSTASVPDNSFFAFSTESPVSEPVPATEGDVIDAETLDYLELVSEEFAFMLDSIKDEYAKVTKMNLLNVQQNLETFLANHPTLTDAEKDRYRGLQHYYDVMQAFGEAIASSTLNELRSDSKYSDAFDPLTGDWAHDFKDFAAKENLSLLMPPLAIPNDLNSLSPQDAVNLKNALQAVMNTDPVSYFARYRDNAQADVAEVLEDMRGIKAQMKLKVEMSAKTNFPLFDYVALEGNLPDFREEGLQPIMALTHHYFFKWNPRRDSTGEVMKDLETGKILGDYDFDSGVNVDILLERLEKKEIDEEVFYYLNIEPWYLPNLHKTNREKFDWALGQLKLAAKTIHAFNPNLLVGFYRLLPDPNLAAAYAGPESTLYREWQEHNDRVAAALEDHVDFLAPSLYSRHLFCGADIICRRSAQHTSDDIDWNHTWERWKIAAEADLSEAAREKEEGDRDRKPIIPFVGTYHHPNGTIDLPGTPYHGLTNNISGWKPVEGHLMASQLKTLFELAQQYGIVDAAIVYADAGYDKGSPNAGQWDPELEQGEDNWWQAIKQFVQDHKVTAAEGEPDEPPEPEPDEPSAPAIEVAGEIPKVITTLDNPLVVRYQVDEGEVQVMEFTDLNIGRNNLSIEVDNPQGEPTRFNFSVYAWTHAFMPPPNAADGGVDVNILDWTANPSATGYHIYRRPLGSLEWLSEPYATVSGQTRFIDTEIDGDAAYQYDVRAFDDSGELLDKTQVSRSANYEHDTRLEPENVLVVINRDEPALVDVTAPVAEAVRANGKLDPISEEALLAYLGLSPAALQDGSEAIWMIHKDEDGKIWVPIGVYYAFRRNIPKENIVFLDNVPAEERVQMSDELFRARFIDPLVSHMQEEGILPDIKSLVFMHRFPLKIGESIPANYEVLVDPTWTPSFEERIHLELSQALGMNPDPKRYDLGHSISRDLGDEGFIVTRMEAPDTPDRSAIQIIYDNINRSIMAEEEYRFGDAEWLENTSLSSYIDLLGGAGQHDAHTFPHAAVRLGESGLFGDAVEREFVALHLDKEYTLSELDRDGDRRYDNTFLYLGWYSHLGYPVFPNQYGFDVEPGAFGWHLESSAARSWRITSWGNGQYRPWGPNLLADGFVATLGSVNEPYLHGHTDPAKFIHYMTNGYTFAEAAWLATDETATKQMSVNADPLYSPFKHLDQVTVSTLPNGLTRRQWHLDAAGNTAYIDYDAGTGRRSREQLPDGTQILYLDDGRAVFYQPDLGGSHHDLIVYSKTGKLVSWGRIPQGGSDVERDDVLIMPDGSIRVERRYRGTDKVDTFDQDGFLLTLDSGGSVVDRSLVTDGTVYGTGAIRYRNYGSVTVTPLTVGGETRGVITKLTRPDGTYVEVDYDTASFRIREARFYDGDDMLRVTLNAVGDGGTPYGITYFDINSEWTDRVAGEPFVSEQLIKFLNQAEQFQVNHVARARDFGVRDALILAVSSQLGSSDPSFDLDGSGTVDVDDFSILADFFDSSPSAEESQTVFDKITGAVDARLGFHATHPEYLAQLDVTGDELIDTRDLFLIQFVLATRANRSLDEVVESLLFAGFMGWIDSGAFSWSPEEFESLVTDEWHVELRSMSDSDVALYLDSASRAFEARFGLAEGNETFDSRFDLTRDGVITPLDLTALRAWAKYHRPQLFDIVLIDLVSPIPPVTDEDEIEVRYKVNGGPVQSEVFDLSDGANQFSLDVTDSAGNVGRIIFEVTLNAAVPEIDPHPTPSPSPEGEPESDDGEGREELSSSGQPRIEIQSAYLIESASADRTTFAARPSVSAEDSEEEEEELWWQRKSSQAENEPLQKSSSAYRPPRFNLIIDPAQLDLSGTRVEVSTKQLLLPLFEDKRTDTNPISATLNEVGLPRPRLDKIMLLPLPPEGAVEAVTHERTLKVDRSTESLS